MNNPSTIIEFKGKETLETVYRIQIDSLEKAVALAAGDSSLLHQYELELKSTLAHISNLQYSNAQTKWIEKTNQFNEKCRQELA